MRFFLCHCITSCWNAKLCPICLLSFTCISPLNTWAIYCLWTGITIAQGVMHCEPSHCREAKSSPWNSLGKGKPDLGLRDIMPSCLATSFWLGVITWYLDRHNIKCFLCIWKYQDLNQSEEFPTPMVCQTDLPMASLFLKLATGWICVWRTCGAGRVRDWWCDALSLSYLKATFTT